MKNINEGVLILSHCGYSFIDDLTKMVNDKGLESFVLSSLPVEQSEKRINYLHTIADQVIVTHQHALDWNDVDGALKKLNSLGKKIIACISVWEGYRIFMSRINDMIGDVEDLNQDIILILRDKFFLRKNLRANGFSNVNADLLTYEKFKEYKQLQLKKFIKPRYGIASFGAFSLKNETSWDVIELIKNQINDDPEYRSLFGSHAELIIEDYIEGDEYSFEMLVLNGKPYVIAIHEKIELQAEETTLLENACVSPPENLSEDDILNATGWLESIFDHLNIQAGCFHVEARKINTNWEIIEINPRIGGAFIAQSVEQLTDGHNFLELWLRCLLAKNDNMKNCLSKMLHDMSTKSHSFFARTKSTLFRVFFANKSGVVKNVNIKNMEISPSIIKSFVSPGQRLKITSREFFVGQALWSLHKSEKHQISKILNESKNLIEVAYE